MHFFTEKEKEVIFWTWLTYIILNKKQGENAMKFNHESQPIGLFENIYESTAEQSLDADINLPDYCPEIQRILKCVVNANVCSVHNNSGRVTTDANAVVRLIYVGDNGKTAAFEQTYPLQKIVESNNITSDSAVSVRINTDYVNCRAVNPRRVDIRAMLTFVFKAIKKRNENVLCSVQGAGIQTLSKKHMLASLAGLCEKSFAMSEVIEIGENKEPVSQIINVFAVANADDIKIISNKALVKGELTLKIHYFAEENGAVECVEHSMPISQILEIDGINENDISGIRLTVSSCEAIPKADSSGEIRLIDLNAVVSAFMTVFEESEINLISDAYSTEYDVKTACKNIEALEFNDKIETSFTNKVILESIGVSVNNVVAAWCSDIKYGFSAKENQCVINGTYQATVIYKDSDNQTGIIQKSVDFEYTHKLNYPAERINCYGSVALSACSCAVTGDSRLEMKTEINISILALSCQNKKYISSIEILNENSKKDSACALTVYFCDKNESVWNIAKKYNTTVEAIINENDLKTDCIENGGMILIPSA